MTVTKARPARGSAPHSLTCREVRPGSRLAHEYVRRASLIPRTFTFLLEQNLTPPNQKYLASPSLRGYRLQGSQEGPEVGPGTEDPADRLPVGSGSAGEGAAFPDPERVRNPSADCLAKEAGRAAHGFRPASRGGRSWRPSPPPSGTCGTRPAGAGRLRPPDSQPSSAGLDAAPRLVGSAKG